MRNGVKHWVNVRVLTMIDDSDQIGFLENFKRWLRMQDHTKNWAYLAPKRRQHRRHGKRVLEWKQKISQWMAPKEPLLGHFKFRV
jgi:translation initiation factor IF-3